MLHIIILYMYDNNTIFLARVRRFFERALCVVSLWTFSIGMWTGENLHEREEGLSWRA